MTELKAGIELDTLVAERVMGLELRPLPGLDGKYTLLSNEGGIRSWEKLPNYSTDIADAWQVVERMKAAGWIYEVSSHNRLSLHCARFGRGDYDFDNDAFQEERTRCAETAPLAICLVALETVDVTP